MRAYHDVHLSSAVKSKVRQVSQDKPNFVND